MSTRLISLSHPGAAPHIPLQRPVLLIGRHPECDIRLDLPQVSRRHCCVALAYDRLMIRDLGSRHGVRVNGKPVEEARLVGGDEIAIGPLIYRLELGVPEPSPPKPALTPTASPPKPAGLPEIPAGVGSDEDLIPLSGLFPEH